MKKYMIITAFSFILGATASQSMEKQDVFELQHGKTKIKMTFQNDQNENKPDETVAQKETPSSQTQPAVQYIVGTDPDFDKIDSIDTMALYCMNHQKPLYYQAHIGAGSNYWQLDVVTSYHGDFLTGIGKNIFPPIQGKLCKFITMKNNIVTAGLPLPIGEESSTSSQCTNLHIKDTDPDFFKINSFDTMAQYCMDKRQPLYYQITPTGGPNYWQFDTVTSYKGDSITGIARNYWSLAQKQLCKLVITKNNIQTLGIPVPD